MIESTILYLSAVRRYWHTLRYLRPIQLYGRLWFRLYRPHPQLTPAPPIRYHNNTWQKPAQRDSSLVGPYEFLFLGERHSLHEVGWNEAKHEKLWCYNQHYFDDLNAKNAVDRKAWHITLLQDWVRRNPPTTGTGWEPYPTSLRMVNWVKWALANNPLPEVCIHSLAVQARWLSKRLEIHLLGNHLFANAKALVFVGLFFEGNEAVGWLKTGIRVLTREMPEQILPDGGQFERSTMYHALALEDMLDLYNIGATYADSLDNEGQRQFEKWRQYIPKMIHWLHTMCHPDGEISFFNDAALGVAPSVAELGSYALRLGFDVSLPTSDINQPNNKIIHLCESGYICLQVKDAVLFADVAPIGPDYLPGHAHADTLSFELSLFGQRVVINGGTSCYGISSVRTKERGTAAHNTVVINGENSSEIWGGFRVARRAYPFGLEIKKGFDFLSVKCAHDGYQRLLGKPIHWRKWLLTENSLVVCDHIQGIFQSAVAYFHFHPDTHLVGSSHGAWLLQRNAKKNIYIRIKKGCAQHTSSNYAPQFGMRRENPCLLITLENSRSEVEISWGI